MTQPDLFSELPDDAAAAELTIKASEIQHRSGIKKGIQELAKLAVRQKLSVADVDTSIAALQARKAALTAPRDDGDVTYPPTDPIADAAGPHSNPHWFEAGHDDARFNGQTDPHVDDAADL